MLAAIFVAGRSPILRTLASVSDGRRNVFLFSRQKNQLQLFHYLDGRILSCVAYVYHIQESDIVP